MRNLLLLLGLIILFGCISDNPIQNVPQNHSSVLNTPYELPFLNELKKGTPPFDLDLSLDQNSTSFFTLTATLGLDSGDYVVSPYTSQELLGVYDMSLLDSTDVQFVGELTEFPKPSALRVHYEDQPVLSYTGSTRISRSVEILSNADFESYGEIFFVHEPSCYPYVVSFVISRKSNTFSITKLSTLNTLLW